MRDFIEIFVPPMMILLGITIVVGTLYKGVGHYECHSYGEVTGLEVKHVGMETCMIKDPDYGWMSYGERKAARFGERQQ